MPPADYIAEPPHRKEEGGDSQCVAEDNPLDGRKIGVKMGADVRQRNVKAGEIDDGDEGPHRQGAQHPPLIVFPLAELRGCRE